MLSSRTSLLQTYLGLSVEADASQQKSDCLSPVREAHSAVMVTKRLLPACLPVACLYPMGPSPLCTSPEPSNDWFNPPSHPLSFLYQACPQTPLGWFIPGSLQGKKDKALLWIATCGSCLFLLCQLKWSAHGRAGIPLCPGASMEAVPVP